MSTQSPLNAQSLRPRPPSTSAEYTKPQNALFPHKTSKTFSGEEARTSFQNKPPLERGHPLPGPTPRRLPRLQRGLYAFDASTYAASPIKSHAFSPATGVDGMQ